MTFLAGGFETTASAIQFALYEMAMKPEIQDAARQEIVDVLGRHGGELTYEAIFEMEYISRIIEGEILFFGFMLVAT